MALYLVTVAENKKRKKLLTGYAYVIISLIILGATFFLDKRNNLIRILNTVIFINFGWTGISKIRNANREESLEITPEFIRFNQKFDLRRFTEVRWTDIRWIKQEKKDTLVFFQDSSLSQTLALTDFTALQQTNILQVIQELALQRTIRLINFSEPVSESV